MKTSLIALTVLGASALCVPSFGQTYDAASGFSAASNPSGPWSYGFENSLGGTFNIDPISGSVGAIDFWKGNTIGDGNPGAYHNSTGSTVNIGTVQWDPYMLILHPGPAGQYSIARFIVPTTGLYNVSATFSGQDFVGGTTTDVHMLQNNAVIYNNFINGFHDAHSFGYTTVLTAGETVDVAVGFGTNQNYTFDSTGVQFRLTRVVPEPMTFGFAGCAALAGFLRIRRKRKSA